MVTRDFNTSANNEWAVILGGSSGLGLASAKKLASHGMNICIVHRTRRSKINEFAKACEEMRGSDVKVSDFNIDALKREGIEKVGEFFSNNSGKVKVLLHSIARGNLKPMFALEANEKLLTGHDFALTIEAMATSLYDWARFLATEKLFAGSARILAFTSEGSSKPLANYGAVSAAKASLEAITRSLAFEYAPLNVTANCIQAGVTDTESLQLIPESDQIKEYSKKRNPYGRLTIPEDVANVVYLLTKDEAKWINGTVIPVDGGEHLR